MSGSGGRPGPDALAERVLAGERAALARAITLVESARESDRALADALLQRLAAAPARARRIGVSGVPGVGKSTFIERLGLRLVRRGMKVAVLAVDPSSTVSGGSILGDKARMNELALEENAFIRPSPSAATLGGVARRTREAMLVCEAAGFDVVLIETVGVGQSEIAVADMTDVFLVLMLPDAGDRLQGIKRGILELADVVAVNKADGEGAAAAARACREYAAALAHARPRAGDWRPVVLAVSARTGEGLDELWEVVERRCVAGTDAGALEARRRAQHERWLWSEVEERLLAGLRADAALDGLRAELLAALAAGRLTPGEAARRLREAL